VAYTQIADSDRDLADAPMTVLQTARFLWDVKPMMADSEREELVALFGRQPGRR